MGSEIKYIEKQCLFCKTDESCEAGGNLVELYPQTFTDEDLNPDVFSARRTTEHYHYRMVKCKKTGLVFSREILPDKILHELYADSKVTFNEHTDLIRKDYWKPISSFSESFNMNNALEIGCSTGFFLEELLERGFENVYGCEPSLEARGMADSKVKENIKVGFFKEKMFEDGFFDFICSFQTLDHLSNPLDTLRICYDIMKPNGYIYLITHDTESLQAKLFGEKSPIIDVEHVYLFNKKTLSMVGEKAGFSTVGVFDIKNTYPLHYWLRMSPIPLKSAFMATAKMLGLSNKNLSIKPGNIGVLLRKEAV